MKKLFVFGIDGAMPEMIYGEWKEDLPNLKKLIESGSHGILNSTIPPLSITAWSTILTGKPPADTGIFEYVYRKNRSCKEFNVMTSLNLKEKTLWQILSDNGKPSVICNILQTWPIKPFDGCMITGPLTPMTPDTKFVYPEELKEELEDKFGEIPPVDVPNFRTLSKKGIIEGIYKITEKNIEIMKYLLKEKRWELFFAMIPWSDRMNHLFWKYVDKKHRKYDPQSEFKNALKDYYKFLDKKLGEFLDLLDEETKVVVLSDHGITRMHTRVNLTDWLIQEGYLFLNREITETQEFKFEMVDWTKTKAFALGSYEGQLFINLKGREPHGIVEPEEYGSLIGEISAKLKTIKGELGEDLKTEIYEKKDYFQGKHNEDAPDLMIYFDGLEYGANTTMVGNKTLWSPQGSKGSDDAGHSKQGIFIMNNDSGEERNLGEVEAIDVAPTLLNSLSLLIPEDMKGKILGS